MTTVCAIKWNDCEKIINQLYKDNPYLTPYQSWEYLDKTGKGFTARHPFDMLGLNSCCFVLYEDERPVIVAPLLVKKQNGRKQVYLRGHFTGAGNLDYIYESNLSYEHFSTLMNEMSKVLNNPKWIIDRISEKSLTFKYWKRYVNGLNVIENAEKCVEIITETTHEEWMKGLSKSVKQNVRTSYNRLNTDGRVLKTEIHFDCKIPNLVFNEMIKVASKRAVEYDKRTQKWLWKVYYPLKKLDPVIRFFEKYTHCFFAAVYIDGTLAASLMGFKSNDNRYIIPRLSYNSEFYRYSPGGILVNETMKKLCEVETKVDFDLSRGEEKYKYDFGGQEHLIYSFEFMCK